MTQEQMTLVEIKATIMQLQEQVKTMERPKCVYPMWFKNRNGSVIKFVSLTEGDCVIAKSYNHLGMSDNWAPHTNTSIWEQVPEPETQWEPKGGRYVALADECNYNVIIKKTREEFSLEYETKEQAKWARDYMRRFNRLLAYVAEFDIDENGIQWKPNWSDATKNKYYIYYDLIYEKWEVFNTVQYNQIMVYMSHKYAIELVRKLNEGIVHL